MTYEQFLVHFKRQNLMSGKTEDGTEVTGRIEDFWTSQPLMGLVNNTAPEVVVLMFGSSEYTVTGESLKFYGV